MPRKHTSRKALAAFGLALCSSLALAATDTRKSAGDTVDDAVVTTRVKTALIGDPTTKARDIKVETARGVVQLSGFVDSAAEKSRATALARQVPGAKSVENKLDVRSESRTTGGAIDDTMLTAKVKAALVGDSKTKASEVNVSTHSGTVQLSGTVGSEDAKAEAARVAGEVKGVQNVENKIDVK